MSTMLSAVKRHNVCRIEVLWHCFFTATA
jgi:hypothetical protein